jgi:hypothetical protein
LVEKRSLAVPTGTYQTYAFTHSDSREIAFGLLFTVAKWFTIQYIALNDKWVFCHFACGEVGMNGNYLIEIIVIRKR